VPLHKDICERTYMWVFPWAHFISLDTPQPYWVPLSTGVSHFPILLSFSYLLRISCACILHSRKFSKFSICLCLCTCIHVSKALVPLKLSALCDKSTYLSLSLCLFSFTIFFSVYCFVCVAVLESCF